MAIPENINIYRVYVIKQRRGGSEIITHLSTKTPLGIVLTLDQCKKIGIEIEKRLH